MRYFIVALVVLFLAFEFLTIAHAYEEPQISIYQGSEPKTSVIVVVWPDGVKETLKLQNNAQGYTTWFEQRYDAYEKRANKN